MVWFIDILSGFQRTPGNSAVGRWAAESKTGVPAARGQVETSTLVFHCPLSYATHMIKSFRHRGIETFFTTGSKAGIQPHHAARLARQLKLLDRAKRPEDMNIPGWKLHQLAHDLAGHWSVWVNGNWRLTFAFDDDDAILVDYQDYH
jgi:proteic killer suppression protein